MKQTSKRTLLAALIGLATFVGNVFSATASVGENDANDNGDSLQIEQLQEMVVRSVRASSKTLPTNPGTTWRQRQRIRTMSPRAAHASRPTPMTPWSGVRRRASRTPR